MGRGAILLVVPRGFVIGFLVDLAAVCDLCKAISGRSRNLYLFGIKNTDCYGVMHNL